MMRATKTIAPLLVLAAGAWVAGCSDDGDDTPDATVVADSGPRADARADSGPADSGDPADTGTPVDSGEEDAGGPMTETFTAFLWGAEEVPPVRTTATGTATFTVDEAGRTTYAIQHSVAGATAAHIHLAIAGETGGPIIPLEPVSANMSGNFELSPRDLEALREGRLYVNIHSGANPGGEIRGQILMPGERLFVAALEGLQETPPVSTPASGVAQLVLSADRTSVRYLLSQTATATGMHVHGAPVGVAGGVLFPLDENGGSFALPAVQLDGLLDGLWYVNVHTAANMGGEIRGQITEPGATIFSAHLTGEQEIPEVVTNAEGFGQLLLDYWQTEATYYVQHTASATTAAHVHEAPGGLSGGVEFGLTASDDAFRGRETVTAGQVTELMRGLWYFNVHTTGNPGGEIRGQILRIGEVLFTARLTGAEEVPPVNTNASGGVGVILSRTRDEIRYDGAVQMLTATAAHIHEAPPGMEGNPVITLSITNAGILSGDAPMTAADVSALATGNWYVNVHTMANPGGEVRGQLERK